MTEQRGLHRSPLRELPRRTIGCARAACSPHAPGITDLVVGFCFVAPPAVMWLGPRAYSAMMVLLLLAYTVAFWAEQTSATPHREFDEVRDCPKTPDGQHNWFDITALSDNERVELCAECNLERRRPGEPPR